MDATTTSPFVDEHPCARRLYGLLTYGERASGRCRGPRTLPASRVVGYAPPRPRSAAARGLHHPPTRTPRASRAWHSCCSQTPLTRHAMRMDGCAGTADVADESKLLVPALPTPACHLSCEAGKPPIPPCGPREARGKLAPAEAVSALRDEHAHCFRSMRAATGMRLMSASNVMGCATDAAPSRAGPCLNGGSNYVRPATGQRRITARVMRSFTPRHGPRRRSPRLGVHTLPFQAHPRVASKPKSPARALATLFGLPATLRAGTESVLFPWRCFR
jgi:hypothetical protein